MNIYGADGVEYSVEAKDELERLKKHGRDNLLVCMAKTQNSISDNDALLGRPTGFNISIKEIRLSNGAGFIVPLTGKVLTMPGLPKLPAANNMDILDDGTIKGYSKMLLDGRKAASELKQSLIEQIKNTKG